MSTIQYTRYHPAEFHSTAQCSSNIKQRYQSYHCTTTSTL